MLRLSELRLREAARVAARLREQLPQRERALALWQVVLGMQTRGVDIQPRVHALMAALDLGPNVLALRSQLRGSAHDLEDEIARLYGELHAATGDDARYDELLHRLRSLQAEEARRMAKAFANRSVLRANEVTRAFGRADELLAEHANPPT